MANKSEVDVEELKKALSLIKPGGELFEVRVLQDKRVLSGYFTDADTLIKKLKTVDLENANVFYTLNAIDPECYNRQQKDKFLVAKNTTSDNDIIAYRWLLIDLDPKRKTGISSTREECNEADKCSERIRRYLEGELLFPHPIKAFSGNGIHLLYPIDLDNDTKEHMEENTALIEKCLKALALMFTDDKVDVDTSVFNPARISKLYGTWAHKGADSEKRPHRKSVIMEEPEPKICVDRTQLERLAEEYPQEVTTPKMASKGSFELDKWLNVHGIRVHAVKEWKDATRYVLDECPFDSNHKAPDATIIQMRSGAICFKCLHNSCSGRDWRELRLKFEPDAYDDKDAEHDAWIEEGYRQTKKLWERKRYLNYNDNRDDLTYQEKPADTEHPEVMFETARDILNKPVKPRILIQTGLIDLDRKTGGLAKGEISLVSGLRGSAKSTWLSQVALNAVNQKMKVAFYSGELKDTRFMNWMYQQAAGPRYVIQSREYSNFWYCRDDVKELIADWLGDRFQLYNNDYGNNFKSLTSSLQTILKIMAIDLMIIDNMSILDLSDITDDRRADKWDQQKLFVETLKNLAMLGSCHIIFVAHPRKSAGFLRLDDVGGSGSLGNLVDNAFIVHRVNRDFRRGYKRDILGLPENAKSFVDDEDEAIGQLGDNCIEVVKERETGLQDLFIPLRFERESKRLKNIHIKKNEEGEVVEKWVEEFPDYGWNYGNVEPEQDEPAPWEQEETKGE